MARMIDMHVARRWLLLGICLLLSAGQFTPSVEAQAQAKRGDAVNHAQQSLIQDAKLGYPTPAKPYYHYTLKLDLPKASQLDVQAWVDGQKQRKLSIRNEQPEASRPLIHYRPAFANTYAVDTRKYDDPYVSGWLAWQPGKTYQIRLRVRMREGLKPSDKDTVLEDTVTLTAPSRRPCSTLHGKITRRWWLLRDGRH